MADLTAMRVMLVHPDADEAGRLVGMLHAFGFSNTVRAASLEEAGAPPGASRLDRDGGFDLLVADAAAFPNGARSFTDGNARPCEAHGVPVVLLIDSKAWHEIPGLVLEDTGVTSVVIKPVKAIDLIPCVAAALRLKRDRDRTGVYLDIAEEVLLGLDTRGRITFINRKGCEVLGYDADELLGANWFRCCLPKSVRDRELADFERAINGDVELSDRVESPIMTRSGLERMMAWRRRISTDSEHRLNGLVASGTDVTETHTLTRQLTFHERHDTVTGLVNRREFELRLEGALVSARRDGHEHALCYLDLDRFKFMNDMFGHVAGDELLRRIAALLLERVRKSDLVARLGSDEFGVLLERTSLDEARRVAESLRATVDEFRFAWGDQQFAFGVSVGLVPISESSTSTVEVLGVSNAACNMAKEEGGHRIHVYKPDDAALVKRQGEVRWVARLHDALEADRFRLMYQTIAGVPDAAGWPVADVAFAEACGDGPGDHFELLLRLENDAGESVKPAMFLPAAERYHLAPKIDRWVANAAFAWLSGSAGRLERLGTCAINLSGQSLADEQFLEFVTRSLQEYEIPPGKICFEVTETAAIANMSAAIRFMNQLQALGCVFALDDFGAGVSSFAYLKTLPVDYLKIDGMFVLGMADDPIDLALVRSINEMGQVMGKRTIAEFAENEAILHKLAEVGVDFAQGYGVSVPRPIEEFESSVWETSRTSTQPRRANGSC